MIDAVDIHVKGIVQGVGFRPFVYRMAKKYLINGWVLNATDGVHIHAEGESALVDEFIMELSDNPPAASRVEEIDIKEVPLEDFDSFEIRFSDDDAVEETTLVSPELATCEDCVRELFNPNDRRYRYPFINCTNCGPRFTIIDHLPYDRVATSMAAFPMCEKCAAEYADPLDRRFHAQPDACSECGPSVTWSVGTDDDKLVGKTREESDAIFAAAVEMLMEGKILAVKGLGGFHLVCDANNAEA
ncbi:MAG: acylphosphatase, partial [Adlercreutzia sp.]|nr:acylphosphatase [Adlercreutzia sp.]